MTLVSLKNGNANSNGAFKAEFSDGSSFLVAVCYLPDELNPILHDASGIYAGRELTPLDEEAFRFAASCFKVEKAALRLIARAEQNSLGLISKLKRRFPDTAAVNTVVSRLIDNNLLDNGRYAERWVRSRLSAKKAVSPKWLLVSLGKRGIPRDASLDALEKALDPDTEYELLLRCLKKAGFVKYKGGISLKAQLKYEGFSPAALERYFNQEE